MFTVFKKNVSLEHQNIFIMGYQVFNLTSFEKQQLEAIEKWSKIEPSLFDKVLDKALDPAKKVIQVIVPEAAIEGAINLIDKFAGALADSEDIKRDGKVSSIEELRTKNLKVSDDIANNVHNWAVSLAAVEGGSTGALGFAGLALDIPALMTLSIRTIHKIALCYGYECNTREDQQFILGVIQAANAGTEADKVNSIFLLQCIATMAAKTSWKKMAEKAAAKLTEEQVIALCEKYIAKGLLSVKDLAKLIGIHISKDLVEKSVPIIGGVIGAGCNSAYVNDIAWAARYMYSQRWLIDNGKIVLDSDSEEFKRN